MLNFCKKGLFLARYFAQYAWLLERTIEKSPLRLNRRVNHLHRTCGCEDMRFWYPFPIRKCVKSVLWWVFSSTIGGGGQEKIPGTYGEVSGCPDHTFWDFFPSILDFSKGKSLLFEQFQAFFFFCIFVSNFALFC